MKFGSAVLGFIYEQTGENQTYILSYDPPLRSLSMEPTNQHFETIENLDSMEPESDIGNCSCKVFTIK